MLVSAFFAFRDTAEDAGESPRVGCGYIICAGPEAAAGRDASLPPAVSALSAGTLQSDKRSHEGGFVAEVEVELIEAEDRWVTVD